MVALTLGAGVDPWRRTPEAADSSTLPVPRLFTDVAKLVGCAATRAEDLVLQLRLMVDANGDDGGVRIDPRAGVGLCATGTPVLPGHRCVRD